MRDPLNLLRNILNWVCAKRAATSFRSNLQHSVRIGFFCLAGVYLIGTSAQSAEPGPSCAMPLARVVAIQGAVDTRAQNIDWHPLAVEQALCINDEVRVGAGGRAALRLSNGSSLPLDQNTEVILRGWDSKGSTLLVELRSGKLNVALGKGAPLQILTPHGRIDATDGEMAVRVTPQQAAISVLQGKAQINNPEGSLQLEGDETAYFAQWSAPKRDFTVKPQDMVQWTAQSPLFLAPNVDNNPAWAEATRAYQQGRSVEALIAMDAVPESARSADYYVFRANIMLFAGRMEEARTNVSRALNLNANSAPAWAMQSVVDLARNDAKQALSAAKRAVKLDANAAGAQYAYSYALQANRQADAALAAAQRAAQLAPQSALALTRLAELQLAAGDTAAAAQSATKAEEIDPQSADAKTIHGFIYLRAKQLEQARAAFLAAIKLNSSDPKSRLGLGLTRIYAGQLQAGREDLELAVSLDPEHPLLRTYLGRAYDAEGRTRDAAEQYARAKQLDPRDPTAYFFDALQKAEINQPVSASVQLQSALQRNENRSVYRGQALLNEDQAVRIANDSALDRVLGFDDLARLKASNAVARAPESAVLHRALGDALATLPRSQPTRESEYLQATLRAPLGSLPVPLFVAESARSSATMTPQHGFFQAVGATQTGYNEFGAVFNASPWHAQGELLAAGKKTLADQIYAAGATGPLGFGLSQLHFKSDGFTEFDRLNNAIWRGSLQLDLPTQTRLYAERSHFDSLRRDVVFPAEPFYFAPFETDEQRTRNRFALRQTLGEQQELLFLFNRDGIRQNVTWLPTPDNGLASAIFNNVLLQRTLSREGQYIFHKPSFNLVAGYASADSRSANDDGSSVSHSLLLTHTYYGYARYLPLPSLQIEVGASRDRQENDADFLQGYSNPKFGVRWQVFPGATFRLAAFSAVNRALASSATLEPTQVAGFNQFYSDGAGFGIRSQNRGAGWDQQLTKYLGVGVERLRRLLAVRVGGNYNQFQERNTRAYINFAVPPELTARFAPAWESSFSIIYDSQDYRRNDVFTGLEQIREYTPRHLRFGANFARNDGLGLNLNVTKVRSYGEFAPVTASLTTSDDTVSSSSNFWMADVALSYRLPKNFGQIVLGVMNLTDRRNFQYLEMDPFNPRFAPERYVYGKLLLAF